MGKRKSEADKRQSSKADESTPSPSSAGDTTKPASRTSKQAKKDVVDERTPGAGSVNEKSPRKPRFNFHSSKFHDIKQTDHFIDKTQFIHVLLQDSPSVLITAPRAFGKSVNLNMVKEFLQLKVHEDGPNVGQVIPMTAENDELFHDQRLWIYQCQCEGQECTRDNPVCERRKFFYEHRGKYPVIYVTFQSVGGNSFVKILLKFRDAISDAFKEHNYLLQCANLWNTETEEDKFDREEFKKYLHPKLASEEEMERDVERALLFLSEVLDRQFGCNLLECKMNSCKHGKKRVYLLVDEYDSPINNSIFKNNVDVNTVNELVTALYKNIAKGNPHVEHAFLTGISFLASVGLSGFRNIEKYLFLLGLDGDDRFVEYFGLTSSEVKTLVLKFQQNFWGGEELLAVDTTLEYYNGYKSIRKPERKVYPIWSVLHALKAGKLTDAWMVSGVMEGSKDATKDPIVRYALSKLLMGCVLECSIPNEVHLQDILNLRDLILKSESVKKKVLLNPDIYMSFLFHQGYLAVSGVSGQKEKYKLRAPNEVIKGEFRKLLTVHYGEDFDRVVGKAVSLFNTMADVTKEHVKQLSRELGLVFKVLHKDWSKQNEDAYHSTLFGILCKTGFKVCTELSGATGRVDLVFHSDNFAVIIEVKYAKSAEAALKQAKDKKYSRIVNEKLSISPDTTLIMGLNITEENKVEIRCELNRKNRKAVVIA